MSESRTSGTGLVVAGALAAATVAGACTQKGNLTGEPLKGASTAEAFEGVQCSAVRPQTEPDLMAWDPGSRANLSRLRRRGIVAVRYQAKGCNVELELLSNCIGRTGAYEFAPYSANERKIAHDASELFAELPVGAARLSGKVKGGRVLRTDYMLAGQYALPPEAVFKRADLRGTDCARATHVVSALYVGAFAMAAGEQRAVEGRASVFGLGGGGASEASIEVLGDEGNAEACRASQKEAKEDERCSVPLRIGLAPLDPPAADSPATPADRPTTAKAGSPAASASRPPEPAPGTMVSIPAGYFWMGSNAGRLADDRARRVRVHAFEMDVTEVTVAEFEACVAADKCTSPLPVTVYWPGITPEQRAKDEPHCNWGKADKRHHPMNCLDSYEAAAYCRWAKKRLPTEEEWEYAARGIDGRTYPWGNDEPKSQLCWRRSGSGTCAVGSFPSGRSPFGLLDMAGNVAEWTASVYSDKGVPDHAAHVVRGGSWGNTSPDGAQGWHRSRSVVRLRASTVGFRCAR